MQQSLAGHHLSVLHEAGAASIVQISCRGCGGSSRPQALRHGPARAAWSRAAWQECKQAEQETERETAAAGKQQSWAGAGRARCWARDAALPLAGAARRRGAPERQALGCELSAPRHGCRAPPHAARAPGAPQDRTAGSGGAAQGHRRGEGRSMGWQGGRRRPGGAARACLPSPSCCPAHLRRHSSSLQQPAAAQARAVQPPSGRSAATAGCWPHHKVVKVIVEAIEHPEPAAHT